MRSPTKTPTPLPDDATLAQRKEKARAWFEDLRDRICAEFERIEELSGMHRELAPGRFERTAWRREAGPDGQFGTSDDVVRQFAVPGYDRCGSGHLRAVAPTYRLHHHS